jgi:hypothetical protein
MTWKVAAIIGIFVLVGYAVLVYLYWRRGKKVRSLGKICAMWRVKYMTAESDTRRLIAQKEAEEMTDDEAIDSLNESLEKWLAIDGTGVRFDDDVRGGTGTNGSTDET